MTGLFKQCPERNATAVPYAIDPEDTRNVESWQDCSNLCQKRIGCKYWTFHQDGGNPNLCVTMKDATNFKRATMYNKISGSSQCIGKGIVLQ